MSKIIRAVFGAGQQSKTYPQWQYDYNTVLQFVGLDLPSTYEVDIANSTTGQSATVLGGADGCVIPAQYFIPGTTIYAWVYIADNNSGYTRAQVSIPISPRAQRTGEEPTPSQQSALDAAIALLNNAADDLQDAVDGIPMAIDNALEEAKQSGEFDGADGAPGAPGSPGPAGADGNCIWYTDTVRVQSGQTVAIISRLQGRAGATPAVDDIVFGKSPDGIDIDTMYIISQISGSLAYLTYVAGITGPKGDDGVSPVVRVTAIEGGHRVTIYDLGHPAGQSFDVLDGQGGSGGSSDYDDLTNKPRINGNTLSGNKTAADLGLAPAGAYVKPSGGIPKTDLASDVQTSLGKADTALQQHQSLAAYRTAAAQDLIDQEQDAAISGKLDSTGDAYRAASIPMGHLDSTSTATVMTAQVDGITELRDGVCVWLRNGVVASASGVTLNVNSLGAKPIYNSLSGAVVTTTFAAASTYLFVYNSARVTGGCWDMVYGYDTNTTYTPVKLGFGYATCSTAEATKAKTAALSSYTLTTGGIVAVKFTNAVPAGSTLNIASKGAKAIHYRGAAITDGIIKAGDTATFIYSTYYHLIAIDRANPTKTSELTNDSGFLTQHQDISGKADKVVEVTVATGGAVSQAVETGKAYHFTGNLTALTITATTPGNGQYHLDFISGSTAPTVALPGAWIMPDGWTVEAGKRYEIDVLDGYGLAQSWEVGA